MAEKKTLKQRLAALWEILAPALSYRTKPGCPTCITPIMDDEGKPVVPHCSRWEEPQPDKSE